MLSRGKLYIVATPIGNLDDISLRAIQTLKTVDWIAAEDTRHSAKLLTHYEISTSLLSLHEFNEQARTVKILDLLKQGQSVALISDAGTPLISDPGYRLVWEARKNHIEVIAIPGSCAAIAALSISGLPTNRFVFEGFLPAKSSARLNHLEKLKQEERTLIFYESPHRALATLNDMAVTFGMERLAVVARELTKFFESVLSDTLKNLIHHFKTHPEEQQGEWVILLQGAESTLDVMDASDSHLMTCLLNELSVKQATQLAAKITGKKKNQLYKLALTLSSKL